MITEIKLDGLDNNPIKTNKKQPPQSKNKNLPPCYFTSIFIGSRGSGKTYSLVKLIKNYERYPIYDVDNCTVAQLVTAPPRGCPPRGFKPSGRPQVHEASLLPLVIKANAI